jgi:hypothetical protein
VPTQLVLAQAPTTRSMTECCVTVADAQARVAALGPGRVLARPVERPVVLARPPAPPVVRPRVLAEARCCRCSRNSQPPGQN